MSSSTRWFVSDYESPNKLIISMNDMEERIFTTILGPTERPNRENWDDPWNDWQEAMELRLDKKGRPLL